MKPKFQYRDRLLTWYSRDLTTIADNFGTPLHVCCQQALQESIEQFLRPFTARQIPLRIFYSVKTNPVPGLLSLLKDEKIGAEVISEFELWLTRKLGFERESIIINGPAKSNNLFRSAFREQVHMITVESMEEVRQLAAAAGEQKTILEVAVRICPSLTARFNPTLDSGSKDSPYGFFPDSDELWDVLRILNNCQQIKFCGFQMHLGSGISRSKPYRKALTVLGKTILKAFKKGWICRKINIGGGFGLPSAPVLKPHQLAAALLLKGGGKAGQRGNEQLLFAVSRELRKTLDILKWNGCEIEEILAEPGRRLTGSAQVILLTVLDVIERKRYGRRFLVCDGGGMSLSPMFLTEAHTVLPLLKRGDNYSAYTIIGNLPSSLDKVSPRVILPRVEKGDRLAVLDTGAYFTSFNNNFAGPRPAVVLIRDEEAKLIRSRESFEEVVSRDVFME